MIPAMRQVTIVLALVGMGHRIGVAQEPVRQYKSSVLGVSIEYPASWTRGYVGACGSGRIGKSEEQLLHLPVYPVRFCDPLGDGDVTMSLYRKFGGDLQDALAWHLRGFAGRDLTNFEFAGGLEGKRLIVCREGGKDVSRIFVTYVLVAQGRRVELSVGCAAKDYPSRQATFDRMARSLTLFPPRLDPSKPGTTKRGRAAGFSFEYPGDWRWEHPWDDQKAMSPTEVRLVAPYDAHRIPREPRTGVTIARRPKEADSLSEVAERTRDVLKGVKDIRLDIRPFENDGRRAGIAIEYTFGIGTPFSSTMLTYFFEAGTEDWVTIQCNCRTSRLKELKPVFERIAKRLRID